LVEERASQESGFSRNTEPSPRHLVASRPSRAAGPPVQSPIIVGDIRVQEAIGPIRRDKPKPSGHGRYRLLGRSLEMREPHTRDADVLLVDGVGNVELVAPGHRRGILPAIELALALETHLRRFTTHDEGAVEGDAVGAQCKSQRRATANGGIFTRRGAGVADNEGGAIGEIAGEAPRGGVGKIRLTRRAPCFATIITHAGVKEWVAATGAEEHYQRTARALEPGRLGEGENVIRLYDARLPTRQTVRDIGK